MLTGAVMVGGRSQRMGRDKAALFLDGETLLQRQLRVLREAGARRLLVVCREGQTVELVVGTEVVVDTVAGAGPIAGLHAALAECRTPHLAVLAVDMPRIEAAWYARLLDSCGPGVGAVARTAAGYEPLAAIYPASALAIAAGQLERGEYSLQVLLAELERRGLMTAFTVAPGEAAALANWNRPEDLAGTEEP